MQKTKIFFIFSLIFLFGVGVFVYGQTDLETERAELEAELERLEREITRSERDLTKTEAEKESLRYQISVIENRINNLNYQIERNNLIIHNLGLEIEDTEESIRITEAKIGDSKEKLEETLRTMYREDRRDLLFILLEEDDISSFFSKITLLERLSEETSSVLDEIRSLKTSLEEEKKVLSSEKSEAERIARMQEMQRREEAAARAEREQLYEMTEEEYQEKLEEKQRLEEQAEEIRSRIFELTGLPEDVDAPTFEEAYEIAEWVSGSTGVRPAFLLSILQQESALGRNVGQCHLADKSSGASVHIETGRRFSNGIHPTRDIPPFLKITSELGRDPLSTPVSCPMSFGYGGAMGPAQFIPSTWQSVRSSVANILGREPDPWSIRDSFMASGVLLSSSGGSSKSGEWSAAMIYFSGGTTNPSYHWYANQVIERANQFERDIEIMSQ